MGILERLGLKRQRGEPKNKYEGNDFSLLFGRTTSGKTVNERTALQTTAVYACVRILSETIASLPLHVYRYTEGGKAKDTEHVLYTLLHDEPNPDMTSFVFRETLMSHLLIWGNAYAQILRDRSGQVIGLYPLLPDQMSVHRSEKGKLYYVYNRYEEDNPNFQEKGSIVLSQEEVLHIPGLGFDGLIGYSPIALAKNAVGMTLACEEYGASFFSNGANPGGVLEHPGILKDPGKVRDSWNAVYQGTRNAHKVAVLEEGMSYKQIGIPPEEAQFLETRKFQINEIARLFRIPPHMVGDLEKSSFSNIEQQSLEFVKYTLDPWVVRFEQALKKSLLLP
ncbi:MAG: phage portal protein, partial [Streptococcus sp.]